MSHVSTFPVTANMDISGLPHYAIIEWLLIQAAESNINGAYDLAIDLAQAASRLAPYYVDRGQYYVEATERAEAEERASHDLKRKAETRRPRR